MSLGFPNTDMYGEHQEGGGESFWPSFTDIMMVIVMTFLLITVSVILNNWELVQSLKESISAEKQATQKARSALHLIQAKSVENQSLDDRVILLENALRQQREKIFLANKNNIKLKTTLEANQQELAGQQAQISTLIVQKDNIKQERIELSQALDQYKQKLLYAQDAQKQSAEQVSELKQERSEHEEELSALQEQLSQQSIDAKNQVSELDNLRNKLSTTVESLQRVTESLEEKEARDNEALITLQSEYKTLDQKYQKLIRPARSTKNKHIVKVFLIKSGSSQRYQIEDQDKPITKISSRSKLERVLGKLKEQYGDDLYVKIIIPKSSNISHSEAWSFTRDILREYDYYHSTEENP
ncbi:MAG: hypothetical protein KAH22_08865 [Thiotrichaceae bacterium]|nr:hypothetical protein [Thiotrichaceae bacterium]